jgi:hypothetical protein
MQKQMPSVLSLVGHDDCVREYAGDAAKVGQTLAIRRRQFAPWPRRY